MQKLSMEELHKITEAIIGAVIEVHKALGPGLLESAYVACLAYELTQRGYKVLQQVSLPLVYKDVKLDCGYRLDLLINDTQYFTKTHRIPENRGAGVRPHPYFRAFPSHFVIY